MYTVRPPKRLGFTLTELLVVFAIIAILALMLYPIYADMLSHKPHPPACLNNQKQLVTNILIYGQDHGKYPGPNWYSSLNLDPILLVCPDSDDRQHGYGMNAYLHGVKADTITNTSTLIATCDAAFSSTTAIDFNRHNNGAIVCHLDGSVKWYKGTDANISGNGNAGRFAIAVIPRKPMQHPNINRKPAR